MRSKDVRLYSAVASQLKVHPPPPETPLGAITIEKKSNAAKHYTENNKLGLTQNLFIEVFKFCR
jgi:hypothetical protein